MPHSHSHSHAHADSTPPSPLESPLLPPSLTLTQTDTVSSVSSTSSRSSFSSIAHAVLPHKHGKHKKHAHHTLPIPTTPIALAELALQTLLTTPGPSCEELRNELLPQLYHEAYQHRVNTREVGLDGLMAVVRLFRSRFKTVRVRFK